MKVPCKGCTDRQPGCHDKCNKYKAFNDEREAIRNKRHVNVESRAYVCDRELYVKEIKYTIDMLSGCKQIFNQSVGDDLTYNGDLPVTGRVLGYELLGREDW